MTEIHVPTQYEAYLQTEQFNEKRKSVFDRDNHKCVVCGSKNNLQVHHLTYRNVFQEPLSDLITLCKNCHATYHAIDRRREAVERIYIAENNKKRKAEIEQQQEEFKTEQNKLIEESRAIEQEIKDEYLKKDYCSNGDLDMLDWSVLNPIINKKCKEHGIDYFHGNKNALRNFFLYRRCELLIRCLDKGLSFTTMITKTKFSQQWLSKWYRRDKCLAKLNEEKELCKED